MMRLNRYLAQCGLGSRRAVESLITEGRVRINGKPVRDLSTQVDPAKDRVACDKEDVQPALRMTYLAMNKPKGYDVTKGDPHSRRRVYDLLPRETHPAVKAVGRLDRDSTGLLLLTNDGELAHRLTHPSCGCTKTYAVEVEGNISRDKVAALTEGVELEDGPARAEEAVFIEAGRDTALLRIVMKEGRNRIVRRMCEAVGHPVVSLQRTAIGRLMLGELKKGETRPLTPRELAALRQAAPPPPSSKSPGKPPSKPARELPRNRPAAPRPAAGAKPDPRPRYPAPKKPENPRQGAPAERPNPPRSFNPGPRNATHPKPRRVPRRSG